MLSREPRQLLSESVYETTPTLSIRGCADKLWFHESGAAQDHRRRGNISDADIYEVVPDYGVKHPDVQINYSGAVRVPEPVSDRTAWSCAKVDSASRSKLARLLPRISKEALQSRHII